ncbi:MAG: hypothetical protein Q9181_005333 [Wetmoreana brouardii]
MVLSQSSDNSTKLLNDTSQGNLTAIIPVQELDYHWTTNVTLGGQQVLLCVDTGSSTLWVTGAEVANNQGRAYNISQSLKAMPHQNETFFQDFPQSSVSGIVVGDTVAFVNTSAVIENFDFGVVEYKSPGITNQPFDGFFGLGFSDHREVGTPLNADSFKGSSLESKPTFFEALMPSLEAPVFSLDFRSSNLNITAGPYMEFGRIDHTKYTGQLAKTPIDRSSNRWTANNITFSIGDLLMDERANLVFGAAPYLSNLL